MKISSPLFSSARPISRYIGLLSLGFIFAVIALYLTSDDRRLRWSGITGVHHMGTDFVVPEFYINGYKGGYIGKEGGGGSNVCCIKLPKKWNPALIADVKWSIADWSKENIKETSAGNYESISWRFFRAIVPIEKYEGEPGHIYVHFFSDGAVRVITSDVGPESPLHLIRSENPLAALKATKGVAESSIFSDSEIEEMRRKASADKETRGK